MFIKNIKSIFLTGTIVLLSLNLMAQTPGFSQTDVIKVAGVTTDAQINALPLGSIQTTRLFIDGLGRPVQTVALQASPVANKDIVQPQAYNTLGQQVKGYLPYTDNSTINPIGSFRTTAITDQASYYTNSGTVSNPNAVANETTYPFGQQVFENSPLQRVMSAGMPGTGYQVGTGKYKTVSYRLNNATQDGNIMIWSTTGTFGSTYYADNTLSVTDGTDEDGQEVRSYSDAAGRTILKRQLNPGANIDTYYLYNLGGAVSYVIPPLALVTMVSSANYSLSASPVKNMIFAYAYDSMGRLIEKKVPSKGKVNIVYDPMNRPVLVQDSNMHAANKWNYMKYDVKGRVINQGIYVDATHTSRGTMQTYVNGLASSYSTTWYESRNIFGTYNFYTNNVFPTTITPLAYAYFDDYDVDNNGSANFTYTGQGLSGETGATTAPVKGMPTAVTQTTVGSGVTANEWFTKVTFYDKRLNPIQTKSNNPIYYQSIFNLTDIKTSVPDFAGVPRITKVSKQTAAATTTTVQTNLSYDYMYRVTAVDQYYNGSGTVNHIAAYSYNELGQVVKKGLGYVNATTWLQNVDMRYNIRGMLTSINNSTMSNDGGLTNSDTNDLFGMTILYDQVDSNLGNIASYSGRPSAVKWISSNGSGGTSYERSYIYKYDKMNRDTAAIYAQRATPGTGSFSITDGWDENQISYDVNGNIKTLHRNAATQGPVNHTNIDKLTYTYGNAADPNQLTSVADASGSTTGFMAGTGTYTYDTNGNLTNEPYKGIASLGYNVLNKTDKITFTVSANRYIDYTYDAGGNLIRKRQFDNVGGVATLQNTTDYIDGFVYLTVGAGSPVLQYFPMPEGRVVYSGTTFIPTYTISDNQGNVRVEFDNTGTGGTVHLRQENSYYAFGMIMPGSAIATPANDNKNLYNGGSEWQKDYGNLPDYYQTFNRNYDAALGRFIGVDPEAESAASMTTYQYADNNPIQNNDPLGNKILADPVDYPDYYKPPGWNTPKGGGHMAVDDGNDMFMTDENSFMGGVLSGNFAFNTFNNSGGKGNYSAFWGGLLASNMSFDDYKTKYNAATANGTKTVDMWVSNDGNVAFTGGGAHTNYLDTQDSNGDWHYIGIDANRGGQYPRGAIGGPVPWYGNFLGPGPDGNPYNLRGYDRKILKPIDMLDAAAQRHDYAYYLAKTGGVKGALLDFQVDAADRALAAAAFDVQVLFNEHKPDPITHQRISADEEVWAQRVTISFGLIGVSKTVGNILGISQYFTH